MLPCLDHLPFSALVLMSKSVHKSISRLQLGVCAASWLATLSLYMFKLFHSAIAAVHVYVQVVILGTTDWSKLCDQTSRLFVYVSMSHLVWFQLPGRLSKTLQKDLHLVYTRLIP